MTQVKRVVLLEQLGRLITDVEKVMALSKVREDRIAWAVRVARIEQQIAALREKWNMPSTVAID